ncbi:hypothetical protein HUS70_20305 [Pandoraea nosoerga]|uniref:Uncharacterized protein n=1 Tax=Pandoraea nosoerga TaxID=2508296 RepID=A0A5E4VUU5_9BURK|nr:MULTISPECIES: hypothetical protein [Pandoraea]MBN4667895.1 hypothetical protein [Pandoraea nosoerga]MBN4677767.1 hypothetical protein [Pandoraea nosoerga]MBN4682930.1 hypothetical protein [Pandoraea nosoerga]MBN4746943.1 hypothetical protein [Pandoraea nosoerga]VVE16212.1 hypothetical protein PNO31109_02891 [Pandoraea nosoerga]
MGNLFDEYPALLVLPEVLLAIVIVAAIVILRRKPSPTRRRRHTRVVQPMPSDTVEGIDPLEPDPAARATSGDPLKREDWSDDRR